MMNTQGRSNSLSKRHFTSITAAVAVALLAAIGVTGCANKKPQHVHRMTSDGKTLTCGTFGTPAHVSTKNIPITGPVTPVTVTVSWTTSGGCTFAGGMVSIFAYKNGTMSYCGKQPLQASPTLNQQTVTVALNVPDNNRPTTGTHDIKCFVTGTMSDGSDLNSFTHANGPTAHCP
jgi:hypothetical protein